MNKSLARVLHAPSLFLAALLQVLPLARVALPVTQNASNIVVIIFRWAVGSTAVLGSVQAMSGASTRISSPKTATATNGYPFSLRLTTSPYQSHYWIVSNLPPGLVLTGQSPSSYWLIEGVPTVAGQYVIGLTAKEYPNSGSGRTVRDTLTMTIISLEPSAPAISQQPTNVVVEAGQDAAFSVLAFATPAPSYQWRREGVEIPGATNATLRLTSLATNDAGAFDVVLTNALGSVTSLLATLTVQPVPLPRAGAGTYNGLFFDTNNLQFTSSGFLTLSVVAAGDYKATLVQGKTKTALIGRFTEEGHATNTVVRVGANPLIIEWHLDAPGGKTLSGRVTDGTWEAPLRGVRAAFNAKTKPATALAGRYTLLIPGAEDDTTAPAGDGAAAATVTTAGLVALTGTLADGSKLVQRTSLGVDGDWPFYVPLYLGRGAVFGWLRVQPENDMDITGTTHWLRPAGSVPKLYTNGFTLDSSAVGSSYLPATGTLFPTNSAWVVLAGGDLSAPSANAVSLIAGGKVLNAGTNALTLAVSPKTGLFKGTVQVPEVLKPVRYQGAVLPGPAIGGGYFAGTNKIGRVIFGP
jgi:hypothetical protein